MDTQHCYYCRMAYPKCICLTCRNDRKPTHSRESCCAEHAEPLSDCPMFSCTEYKPEDGIIDDIIQEETI